MNRSGVMIGVLVVLLGIAGYVWSTKSGTEVDQQFADLKQAYDCPHCGETFELTGAETTRMIEESGRIVCSKCDRGIDDFIAAKAEPNRLGGDDEEITTSDDSDSYSPPKAVGGMKRSDSR